MLRGDVSTCHPARIALHRDEVTGENNKYSVCGEGSAEIGRRILVVARSLPRVQERSTGTG